jgi:predicted ATPase/DNA-binding SARP family transcriptional activator/Tfp pilus assembly protein PilF
MEFRILGSLEVRDGAHVVDVGGERQRALLALLLVRANEVVSVDRLLDELWEGSPPQGARTTLRSHVSRLRKALGGEARAKLLTRAPGYVLQLDASQLDAARFKHLVTQGRQALEAGDWPAASATLHQALELWRGPALTEFASVLSIQAEVIRLEELRLTATEDRVEADLAMGRHGELVGELEMLVAEHPLRERLWGQLILALYRSGRQAEALQAYRQLRHRLTEELGIEPSLALRRLEEEVLLQKPSLEWTPPEPGEPSSARPIGATRHNLPAPLTSFIGREGEVAEVRTLVETCRLVTLTGAGGCGKTRLALEVATALLDERPDAVWFIDFAALADPDLVPHTVIAALGVPEEPGRPLVDLLVKYLRPRRLLLVLDNCEHLVAAAAQLVDRLLRACPGLRVLATSREVLGVPGEVPWRVPSLSAPDPNTLPSPTELAGYESVRLFLERTGAARGERSLRAEDLEAVAQICARLDGIPLAIELAAARTAVLSPKQIAARLDDRFRLLTTGSRTALPRHQTLRATVEWSHDLLDPSERILFRRLAVFAGGFLLEAAEAVCSGGGVDEGDVLDLLAQLVSKSVVLMDDRGTSVRYRLLETMRQYAREQLTKAGELAEMRSRHRDWYLRLAEDVEARAFGVDGRTVLERLDAEHDNFRAALEWSVEDPHGGESGLRLTHALNPLWLLRSHCREGLAWMEALSRRPGEDHAIKSAVARRAANLAFRIGDYGEAMRLSDLALALALRSSERREVGAALMIVAKLAALSKGELERARALFTESLAIGQELGDEILVAGSLLWLGFVAQRQGRYGEARARVAEFQAASGEERWYDQARGLYLLGWVECEQGAYGAARERLENCRVLAASVGNRAYELRAVEALGTVAAAQGRFAEARSSYQEALALSRKLPRVFRVGLPAALGELASVQGDHATAQRLLEEGLERAREVGDVYPLAWTHNRLGSAAAARGDPAAARSAYEEALCIGRRVGMPWHVVTSLEGLAALDVAGGQPDRAALLLGAAEAIRAEIGAPRWPSMREAYERVVDAARVALGETAFAAAHAKGGALTLAQAVALGRAPKRAD